MDAERWSKVKELFNAAIAAAPEQRASLLASLANGDDQLRNEAQRLVNAHGKSADFIETPAFAGLPEFARSDEALIGTRLGHYRIESVLGAGGMGVVYLACDELLDRKVALKLLPSSLAGDEAQLKRLKHEARVASALNHPAIVTIHEIGEADGTHYIATEFIDGMTLRERMAQGSIPANEAVDIAEQVAGALSVAHEAGIVHRDIKPENIMLRRDGYVKVLDFGIAKFAQPHAVAALANTQTRPGAVLGTTRYMSPEQARGRPVDGRTDIWSIGVVLHELVAGAPPFDGETPTDVVAAVLRSEPPALNHFAPAHLRRIVGKALAKDPDGRYQSAADLRRDLQNARGKSDSMMRGGAWKAAIAAVVLLGVPLSGFGPRRTSLCGATGSPSRCCRFKISAPIRTTYISRKEFRTRFSHAYRRFRG